MIKGVVCGVRAENIKEPLIREYDVRINGLL
ncbi:DUF2200 family protein [Lientehia hominis]